MSGILIKSGRKLFSLTELSITTICRPNHLNNLNKLNGKLFSIDTKELDVKNADNFNGKLGSQANSDKMKRSIQANYNVTFDTVPEKSENDKKEYLVMKLSNGLRAILISDVENLLASSEYIQKLESANNLSEPHQKKNLDITKSESDIHIVEVKSAQDLESQLVTELLKSESTLSKSLTKLKLDEQIGVLDNKSTTSTENSPSLQYIGVNKKKLNNPEKLAACSLSVGVGSFSDPEEIPGLAHFLEHMVFMGSDKFPKENDFDSYITTRGGSSNAFTGNEVTSFYFTCPDKHLCKTLDRFANFFISPLMNRDSMSREREAVDSEFQEIISSDSARIEQVLSSMAPLENPAHKFSWGNLISLKNNIADDVLYKTLREFWKKYYSPNLMTVAIQARVPLDVLGMWVAQYFGEIPSNNALLAPIVFPYVDPPFKIDLFNKIYTVMPIEDRNHLQLTWAFPSVKYLYKSKPLSYLYFLIDHKGEGSLFSYLHEQLWIIDLRASGSHNSIFSLFCIDLVLTEKGLEHFEQVIELIFNYIELLRHEGPSERIFRESQIIEELEFRFQYEIEASDYVLRLSQNMQNYPPIDYITGNRLIFEYEPNEITKFSKLMTPNNVNIMILSKSIANKVNLDMTEPWFKTKYKMEDIPEQYLSKWQNCQLNPKLFLPKPNIYIPSCFDIFPLPKELPEYPQNIISDEYIEVWYKQDGKFKLPYGYVKVYLISPITSSSPQNSVLSDIFQWLYSYLMVKEVYPASLAGLNFSLESGYEGLILKFDGFSHKIPLLLNEVFKEIVTFSQNKNISQGLFNAIKEQLRREYYNSVLDPSQLADELFISTLCTNYWNSISELEALQYVTIEKCQEFNANFFENLYIKCLIQGNITKEQAVDMSYMVKKITNYKPLLSGTYPQTRVHVLPSGENIIRVQSFNTQDTNCSITNYYQFGLCSITDHCAVLLLMLMMDEPIFNTLRTQEQLAYSASCQAQDNHGVTGFSMTVSSQADKFKVEHVENRMTLFLKKFMTDVENMSSGEFNRTKESLKILLLIDDTNLGDEVQRNWSEIVNEEYMFDRVKRDIKSIDTIELFHVKLVMKKMLDMKLKDTYEWGLRKLSIQVDGDRAQNVKNEAAVIKETVQINDLQSDLTCSLQMKTSNNKNEQHKFIKSINDFKNQMFIFPCKIRRIKK